MSQQSYKESFLERRKRSIIKTVNYISELADKDFHGDVLLTFVKGEVTLINQGEKIKPLSL